MDREEFILFVQNNDRVITIKDARCCFSGCIPGWQNFCETNNFVWKDVVRHGLLASQLIVIDDAMAEKLVRFVYEEMNNV